MVVQARAEATRDKIIGAALDLFSRRGYGETGLSDVITHAGVSKGAFYYHFESKEALAGAIIHAGTGQLLELFNAITDAKSPALQNTIAATFAIAEVTRENSMALPPTSYASASARSAPLDRRPIGTRSMHSGSRWTRPSLKVMWKATSIPTTSPKQSVSASSGVTCCPTPWVTTCSPG
jgi:AcrR family transcriptional regulator